MPLAERAGLIDPLTRLVLDRSLAACAGWQTAGRTLGVAVNVSARSLLGDALVGDVAALLDRHGVPARLLTLEVAERALAGDPDRAAEALRRLRALGVRVCLDDFGSGHCSLGSLTSLPLDEIKVDRSLVRRLAARPGDVAVLRSVVELGRGLRLDVVAAGVEDATTWHLLRGAGLRAGAGVAPGPPDAGGGARALAGRARGAARRPARTPGRRGVTVRVAPGAAGCPYPFGRDQLRPDRRVRLGCGRPHRGPGPARPAPRRAADLRRGHRARPVRPPAAGRRAPARPGGLRRARQPGREGPGDRLQHRQRGLPARRPRALRRAGGRGRAAGRAPGGGRDPHRPGRDDRHPGHGGERRLRRRVRRRPARHAHERGVPALRRLRRARRDHRPAAAAAGDALPGAGARRRRRRAGPGLHPLPVAHRHDLAGGRRRRGRW